MLDLANEVSEILREQKMVLATAESCTGGLISGTITEIAGSSDIFDRAFITYSNEAKMEMLGVSAETLAQYGAVSAQTATEMVQGALTHSDATIAIAVTGIAGPGGGSPEKPVGLVYIACGLKNKDVLVTKNNFDGSRTEIRQQTVFEALKQIKHRL